MDRSLFPTAAAGAVLILAALVCLPSPARSEGVPEKGDLLPPVVLETPERPEDRAYLGLQDGETFSVASLAAPVLVIEIYSMY